MNFEHLIIWNHFYFTYINDFYNYYKNTVYTHVRTFNISVIRQLYPTGILNEFR